MSVFARWGGAWHTNGDARRPGRVVGIRSLAGDPRDMVGVRRAINPPCLAAMLAAALRQSCDDTDEYMRRLQCVGFIPGGDVRLLLDNYFKKGKLF